MLKRIPTLEEYELEKARKALGLFNVNDLLKFPSEDYNNNNKKPTVRVRRPLKRASSSSLSSYQKEKEKAAKALRLNSGWVLSV